MSNAAVKRAILWSAGAFALPVLFAFAVFLLIGAQGAGLVAPPAVALPPGTSAAAAPPSDILLRVLIALTAVIATGLALGKLFAHVGQPPVIGEIVAGIVLGPSLLGPEASALRVELRGDR